MNQILSNMSSFDRTYAIDTESVEVGEKVPALARVTIIDQWGKTVLDIFVQPTEKVRT